jgi:hypothetical protein
MKRPAQPTGGPIHPALHFDRDQAYVGVFDATGVPWIVGSDRRKRHAERLAEENLLLVPPLRYQPLAGRWPEHDLDQFIAGDGPPAVGDLLNMVTTTIEHYCELADP